MSKAHRTCTCTYTNAMSRFKQIPFTILFQFHKMCNYVCDCLSVSGGNVSEGIFSKFKMV